MAPKKLDPGVRASLMEAAARLVDHGGVDALTIRRLAAEVGTSTMAIYTHFGGMDDLRAELQKEAFGRLNAKVRAVRPTSDPVADSVAMGWAYCVNALTDPAFYRIMFMEEPIDDPDVAAAGTTAFEPCVTAVQRCIDNGRFAPADAFALAIQLWTLCHGFVTLRIAGLMTDEAILTHLPAMALNLFVGFGDDRDKAQRSIERAMTRMGPQTPPDLTASLPPGRDVHRP